VTQTLSAGRVVAGHYRIAERIAGNDVSETFRADNTEGGQAVAVEVFKGSPSAAASHWNACCDQARDAGRLAGHLFVNVLDSGRDDISGSAFLLRELTSAQPLRERVSSSGPLAPRQVSELLSLLTPGFDKIDKIDLVHRGLNPDNVCIADGPAGPSVRVVEFGHAELRSGAPEPAGWSAPDTTSRGVRAAATSDTYSLALVAFYALTGHSYFKEADREEHNARKLQTEQRGRLPLASKRAAELGCSVPESLNAVFSRALSVNPGRRFKTVRELAEAFAKAIPDGVRPEKEGASATPRPARVSVPPPPPSAAHTSVPPGPPPPPRPSRPNASVRPPPPSQRGSSPPSSPKNGELPPPPVPLPTSSPVASSPEPSAPVLDGANTAAIATAVPSANDAVELTPEEVSATDDTAAAETSELASAALALQDLFGTSPAAPLGTPEPDPTAAAASTTNTAVAPTPAATTPRPALDSVEMAAGLSSQRRPKKLFFVAGGGVAAIVLVAVLASGSGEEAPEAAPSAVETDTATATPKTTSPTAKPSAVKPRETAAAEDSASAEEAPQIASVKLVCDPGDCDAVRCDGQRVDDPAKGVELAPGKHECVARKQGYLLSTEGFSVEAGKDQEITFEMKKPARSGSAKRKPSKPKPVRGKPCNPFVEPC